MISDGLIALPDMVFALNIVKFRHEASGFQVQFSAADALAGCAKDADRATRPDIQVVAAQKWAQRYDLVRSSICITRLPSLALSL